MPPTLDPKTIPAVIGWSFQRCSSIRIASNSWIGRWIKERKRAGCCDATSAWNSFICALVATWAEVPLPAWILEERLAAIVQNEAVLRSARAYIGVGAERVSRATWSRR